MITALIVAAAIAAADHSSIRHWPTKNGVDLDSYRTAPKAGPSAPPHYPRHGRYLIVDRSDCRGWIMKGTKTGTRPLVELSLCTGRIVKGRSLTPTGWFYVADSQPWPEWTPTKKDRPSFIRAYGSKFPKTGPVRGGSPMNALGARCLHLVRKGGSAKESHYYIHGHCSLPFIPGTYATGGCVGTGNADVAHLPEDGITVGSLVYIAP